LTLADQAGRCLQKYVNTTQDKVLVAPQKGGTWTYKVQDEMHFWIIDPTPGKCQKGQKMMPMVSGVETDAWY